MQMHPQLVSPTGHRKAAHDGVAAELLPRLPIRTCFAFSLVLFLAVVLGRIVCQPEKEFKDEGSGVKQEVKAWAEGLGNGKWKEGMKAE